MRNLQIGNNIITTPLIEITKRVQSELHNGKLATIKYRGDNVQVTCPFHKGGLEARASAGIYVGDNEKVAYGLFRCFTCGTTCSFSYFVAGCFSCDVSDAEKWLVDNYGEESSEQALILPELCLCKPKKSFIDDRILKNFESFHPYMLQRKLDLAIVEQFNVKYDPKTKCIVFPVYDESGKLVMFTRRSVLDKKFIIDKEKEKPLYLLHYMIKNNIDSFMITEGQIDALTAFGFGMPCVATMGSISMQQIKALNNSGVRCLYICFDNDMAGKRFTQNLLQYLRKDILAIPVDINIPGKKDINDLTLDEFNLCIRNAKEKY